MDSMEAGVRLAASESCQKDLKHSSADGRSEGFLASIPFNNDCICGSLHSGQEFMASSTSQRRELARISFVLLPGNGNRPDINVYHRAPAPKTSTFSQ
mmetsp:Transcript_51030/g.70830  ORF Transcript_51030/g.70830 Transcript_51030/m.70830 type:complete len:98 (-) Transcript_51030:233-526(-)